MKVTILGKGRWAGFHKWYQEKLGNDVLMWGRGDSLEDALGYADYIIVAISAQGLRDLVKQLKVKEEKIFILAMKGIDTESLQTLSQVMRSEFGDKHKICVWVGPGHTNEFMSGQLGVMIIDGECRESALDLVNKFRSDVLRLYFGNDLIGVEIGAAAKNVYGIAAGILDGAGMVALKGALVTRGLREISRLIVAMGGKELTPFGLSHLGDYAATHFSQNSNNRLYGEMFFKKQKCEFLAEGVATSKALYNLSIKHKVDMPIAKFVYDILYHDADPITELKKMFMRDNVEEF